jgi:hypothetical protein
MITVVPIVGIMAYGHRRPERPEVLLLYGAVPVRVSNFGPKNDDATLDRNSITPVAPLFGSTKSE